VGRRVSTIAALLPEVTGKFDSALTDFSGLCYTRGAAHYKKKPGFSSSDPGFPFSATNSQILPNILNG
jgi:hypothetical protein